MSDLRTLYREVLRYSSGSVGLMLLGLVSFPLYARMLPVSEYGLLNLVMKLVFTAVIIAKMGLPHAVVRFYQQRAASPDPAALSQCYATFFWTAAAISSITALTFAAGVLLLPASAISPDMKTRILFASGLIFTTTMNQILVTFFRAAEKSRSYVWAQIGVKAAAIPCAVVLMLAWERSARALVGGMTIAEAASVCALTVLLLRNGSLALRNLDTKFLREILAFGAPMVVFELASAVLDSGDRFLVQHYLGALDLGYYAAAYAVAANCQELVHTPFNLAIVPMYIRLWTSSGLAATAAFLRDSLRDFLIAATGVLALAAACSHEALVLLASSKYDEASRLIPLLVAGLLLYTVATFFYAGLYLNKRTRTIAALVVVSGVFNIALNVSLLPRFGIVSAAYATLASYALLAALAAITSRRLLPLRFPSGTCIRCLFAGGAAVMLARAVLLQNPFLSLLVKAGLVSLVYSGVAWCIEPRARQLARKAVSFGRAQP